MSFQSSAVKSWLKVCITCDRYAKQQADVGAPLADALSDATDKLIGEGVLTFLRVACLSGCHNPGNIALGAHGKTKIRLHGLTIGDLQGLTKLTTLYAASPTGVIPASLWPEQLQGRLATSIDPVWTSKI